MAMAGPIEDIIARLQVLLKTMEPKSPGAMQLIEVIQLLENLKTTTPK